MKRLINLIATGSVLVALFWWVSCSYARPSDRPISPKVNSKFLRDVQLARGLSCNVEIGRQGLSKSTAGVIKIVDSGWTTSSQTSDCVNGWGDDTWELTITQAYDVTITVTDCCCPGDFYEVYIDGELIGTTPNLAPPWGCDFTGPLSSGSFTKTLCPGTYIITVRNVGFDGHSQQEIADQRMCPAGFTITGALSPPAGIAVQATEPSGNGKASILSQATFQIDPIVERLKKLIELITPFVVTDGNGLQHLLEDAARHAGVRADAIELGRKIVALNNRIVSTAMRDQELVLSPEEFTFINPLFLHIAQQQSPCGTFQNPTPCPDRVESGRFFCTQDEVVQYLISLGYHRTADYAGGRSGRDYTLVVPYPGCGEGTFRSQAIIHAQGEFWTYNTQGPEPNPELLSYISNWPYFTWPAYVIWWHIVFC